jgi:phospholipid-translocating ATPase
MADASEFSAPYVQFDGPSKLRTAPAPARAPRQPERRGRFASWCGSCFGASHLEARYIRLNAAQPTRRRFARNIVVNTKYNVLTFVPKVLYEQFRYFFNLYFLLVACSQFFPPLQIGLLVTYIAPLAFVLAVTMCKEGYDDLKRYRTDLEINRELYTRALPGGGHETIR